MTNQEGPDQARSWAIAMAACVINGLLSGINRTTGLFYVALIETYGLSRMEANLPFTLRNVVRNLAGPVVGAIGQRYGARDVTVIGGVLASLGITLCCLAPNVTWICILWGGVHGIGIALGNTLFPVVVNRYFLKYRATASGLSLSGACLGSFVLPVLIEFLLLHYGLSGAFLISGGLIMHVLPASLMMVEPSWIAKTTVIKDIAKHKFSKNSAKIETEKREKPATEVKNVASSKVDNALEVVDGENCALISKDVAADPNFGRTKADIDEKKKDRCEDLIDEPIEEMRRRSDSTKESSEDFSNPTTHEEKQEASISKGLLKMFRSPMFYVISISFSGFATLFDPAITVIVDYIRDKGLQQNDAKYFIIMMALGDLLGRLCLGWVTDRGYVSLPIFMLLLHVIQGACFLVLPLFYTFEALITIITIYGVAAGATLVMYPILVSKYLPSVQSLSFGFLSLFTGLISFAIPSMIGYFRDYVGSYEGMFAITGSLSAVAGCLWLFEPLLSK